MAAAKVVDVLILSAGALRGSAITTRRGVVERGSGVRVVVRARTGVYGVAVVGLVRTCKKPFSSVRVRCASLSA